MAAKKAKTDISTITMGNMTFAGTLKQTGKFMEDAVKAAEKESKLTPAQKKKRLEKLEKAKPVKVKTELPSSIKTKEGKYNITKTKTGKIKITNPQGKTITVPKGTNVTAIAYRGGVGGGLGGLFGIKNR